MPLRCLDQHRESVFAFALNTDAWTKLVAENRKTRHLRTHCCNARVAAKTSRLGTRFFAHMTRGGCATGDESPEHLHLKRLAVEAAQAHGWTAETEVAGATADGAPWRADVLATRGNRRIAVEVQWSAQADDETMRRQQRYAASGVRGLWLFRQARYPESLDLPAARVRGNLAKGMTAFGLVAADFLNAAFAGRMRFGIPEGTLARATLTGAVLECWKAPCSALNRVVHSIEISSGGNSCVVALAHLGDYPQALAAIRDRLPPDRARGRIDHRFSRATGRSDLANSCFACGALIGNGYAEGANNHHTIAVFDLAVNAEMATMIGAVPEFVPAWGVVSAANVAYRIGSD